MTVTTHRALHHGTKGEDVKRTQHYTQVRLDRLNELDQYDIDVDGVVGGRTIDAVFHAAYLMGVGAKHLEHANPKLGNDAFIDQYIQQVLVNPTLRADSEVANARKRRAKLAKQHDKEQTAGPAASPSGLVLAKQAAVLALNHAPAVHYTMGASRWQGISTGRIAAKGEYPNWADCSSFYTWCLWQWLRNGPDVVNGANWQAGFTGTLLTHGRRVTRDVLGAAAIYGSGYPGKHVAFCLGDGTVISHGSEGGPYHLPLRYRSDLMDLRVYW